MLVATSSECPQPLSSRFRRLASLTVCLTASEGIESGMAPEVETSAHSFDEIQAASHAMLTTLHRDSPLTERELVRRLEQPRAVVVLAGTSLEKDRLVTVALEDGEKTYHLCRQPFR